MPRPVSLNARVISCPLMLNEAEYSMVDGCLVGWFVGWLGSVVVVVVFRWMSRFVND